MTVEGALWSRLEQLVADDDGDAGAVAAAVHALHGEVAAARAEVAGLSGTLPGLVGDAVREEVRRVERGLVARQDALGQELVRALAAAADRDAALQQAVAATGEAVRALATTVSAGLADLDATVLDVAAEVRQARAQAREAAGAGEALRAELHDVAERVDAGTAALRTGVQALRGELTASTAQLRDRLLERLEEQRIVLTRQLDAAAARQEAVAEDGLARLAQVQAGAQELRAALSLLRDELPQFLTTAVGGMQRDLERVGAEVRWDVGRVADGLGAVRDAVAVQDDGLVPVLQDQLDALGEVLRGELVLLGTELRRTSGGLAELRSGVLHGAAAVEELREDVLRTAEDLQDLRADLEGGSARADEADDALLRHLREQEQVLRTVLAAGQAGPGAVPTGQPAAPVRVVRRVATRSRAGGAPQPGEPPPVRAADALRPPAGEPRQEPVVQDPAGAVEHSGEGSRRRGLRPPQQ